MDPPAVTRPHVRLLVGLIAVYLMLHGVATALGSTRGEAGIIVGAIVVLACITVERTFFGRPVARGVAELGLGRPASRGMLAALGVSTAMLLVLPAYAVASGITLESYPGWTWLVPGLFAQAGVAEETLFRGYLFRHLRRGRSFWRAAVLSMPPFVLVHLLLFVSMPWPIALAALSLAVIVSFPLAWLFDLGGDTIWAPAIVHFVIQGAIKVITIPPGEGEALPLVWMAAGAILPFGVFLVPRVRGAAPAVAVAQQPA